MFHFVNDNGILWKFKRNNDHVLIIMYNTLYFGVTFYLGVGPADYMECRNVNRNMGNQVLCKFRA